MYRLWISVIKPIFEAMEPRVIVEIGADRGRNTANILDYCRGHQAVVHVIDPLPKFSVEEWQEEWSEATFHQRLSLDALPGIEGMDVVLVDGDHNWYTVINELRLIERNAKKPDRFPLVLLHDVGWPYGRRDCYYMPATIPSRYRHPFATLGMRPGRSQLVEDRGLNAGLANALEENTPRNGVLTAVEDFVSESPLDFHLSVVPGLHGLGILATTTLLQRNQRLADVIASFASSESLLRHCREIERARIRKEIRDHEKRRVLKKRVRELEKLLADPGAIAGREAHRVPAMPSTRHAG